MTDDFEVCPSGTHKVLDEKTQQTIEALAMVEYWRGEAERLSAENEGLIADCDMWKADNERLTARLEKEYERGDKNAQDAVNAQLDVNRLQAKVEALEVALQRIANGHGLQRDIGIAVNALAATEQDK